MGEGLLLPFIGSEVEGFLLQNIALHGLANAGKEERGHRPAKHTHTHGGV